MFSDASATDNGWPERVDPLTTSPGVVAHHLKKYEFALKYVGGLTLDVACGVGYGTAHLATATAFAVGLEIDPDAVNVAGSRYRSVRCLFVRGDACRLPYATGVADAVTCFEGVEHFSDPEGHVAEVARVLRDDGVYLVSTPLEAHVHENPFHLHEFDAHGLTALLGRHFGEVQLLGQRRVQTEAHQAAQRLDVLGLRRLRVLRPLARVVSRTVLRTAPAEEATLDDFVIDGAVDKAYEFVAVCGHPRRK